MLSVYPESHVYLIREVYLRFIYPCIFFLNSAPVFFFFFLALFFNSRITDSEKVGELFLNFLADY